MNLAADRALTGTDTYFEDFTPGQKIRHARGATVGPVENALLTKLSMNTAQSHWNDDRYKEDFFLGGGILVNGFIVSSLVFGLASQDATENFVREIGCTNLRIKAPTHHGDTLYAFTEVLRVEEGDVADAGIVEFQHWGVNQKHVVVFEGKRTVLVRRRPSRS